MNVPAPYYARGQFTLYCGDVREVVPRLELRAALVVADPPYGTTPAVPWDGWPTGWGAVAAAMSDSMWCFSPVRVLLNHAAEFADWRLSHDIVWEKANGSGRVTDRFRRVHDTITHWYRGRWTDLYRDVPRKPSRGLDKSVRRSGDIPHHNGMAARGYVDDGTRMARSVLHHNAVKGIGHQTAKPPELVADLIHYGCPPGGLVLDLFSGSGAAAVAALRTGRSVISIEGNQAFCDDIVERIEAEVKR